MSSDPDIDAVRARFAAAEPLDPPASEEARAPDPAGSGGGRRGPPDDPPPPPPEAEAAGFALNDVGNGRRFVAYWGERFVHVPRVGWYGWDARRWLKDPDQLAVGLVAQSLSERMLDEIAHLRMPRADLDLLAGEPAAGATLQRIAAIPPADRSAEDVRAQAAAEAALAGIASARVRLQKRRDRHRSHANTTGNRDRLRGVLETAGVRLAQPVDALDMAPLDVNCRSGTLAFRVVRPEGCGATASVALRPHDRGDLLTKMIPVDWDPDARAPRFEAFLQRIQPDADMRGFLQRWFGLSMTALTNEQKLVFLYGSGANGKSVLVELMARIMGDYATTAKIESLTGRNRRGGADATPDLVPLIGARMVRASEPEEGERLQEGRIKELTGGEPIQVRALHTDFVEVTPRFKLTISGNHKPEIRGDDEGIWRRVLLVPFDVQIPKVERIPLLELIDDLMGEAPGILNWLAEGLIDYLEAGLAEPAAVLVATQEYRDDSDPVGQFLVQACTVTGRHDDSLTSRELVEGFNFWMAENGSGQWRPGTVQRRIKSKAGAWHDPASGKGFVDRKSAGVMRYDGIRLQEAFARRLADAPRDQQGRPVAGREPGSGGDPGW